MGMDVYGKEPRSTSGEYFRESVWGWHPLWNYCQEVAPDLTGHVQHGHSNDGDGLPDVLAIELGEALAAEIAEGDTAKRVAEIEAELSAMPDEVCSVCGGSGLRANPPATGPGEYGCNGCGGKSSFNGSAFDAAGKGTQRPWPTHYHLREESVREFAEFLRDCGGFRIL